MKLAMVFPGQGSQSVGMLQGYADTQMVRDIFVEASDVLGQDLWKLVSEGPVEDLNSTVNTQPVMLAADYAVYRAWRAAGGTVPAIVAGHSLGEYSALVVAGALNFHDALLLVRFRAQAMQEAVPFGAGGMAAILGLDDETVRAACAEATQGEVVEPVNFNAPGQVVIAGHKTAVERGIAAARAKGARRAVVLPVSAPFHSSLLKPAAQRLAEKLASVTVKAPQIPVINNVDVATIGEPPQIKDALARQACSPVRWVETIQHMALAGVTHVVECGPGKVLSALINRIDNKMHSIALADAASLSQAIQTLK